MSDLIRLVGGQPLSLKNGVAGGKIKQRARGDGYGEARVGCWEIAHAVASYTQPNGINAMLWVFIGLLGGIAFVFLTRLFWSDPSTGSTDGEPSTNGSRKPIVTLAIIMLVLALVVMIATGRLHWLSAAITGAIPFLRRLVQLIRFAPLLKRLFPGLFRPGATRSQPRPQAKSSLTKDQARAMLEVAPGAGREDIVQAHRRLMARNHPDRGGSNYIAAQLNEAKELLLADIESS